MNNYSKTTLSNGLELITIPMPHVDSVTVMVMIGAGSRYETRNTNGIAHFMEHMAFKGSIKRPSALAISSEIDGIGGEFNAFTGKDHTGFYIKARAEHTPLLIDVLSDMILHPILKEEEIEREINLRIVSEDALKKKSTEVVKDSERGGFSFISFIWGLLIGMAAMLIFLIWFNKKKVITNKLK